MYPKNIIVWKEVVFDKNFLTQLSFQQKFFFEKRLAMWNTSLISNGFEISKKIENDTITFIYKLYKN